MHGMSVHLSICLSACLSLEFPPPQNCPKLAKNQPKLVQNMPKYAIVANTKNASMHGMSVHLSVCLSVRLSVSGIFSSQNCPKLSKNKPKLVQNWPKYAIVANTKNASMHGMSVHLSICLSVSSVCLWIFSSQNCPKIGKNQPKLVQNWPKYSIVDSTKNASIHGMSVCPSVCLSVCLSLEFPPSKLPKIGKNQPKLVQNWPKYAIVANTKKQGHIILKILKIKPSYYNLKNGLFVSNAESNK